MISATLFAEAFSGNALAQQVVNGLSFGMLIALIALGYTMVYGIVELINFAHGDLFMLGGFFALTLLGAFNLTNPNVVADQPAGAVAAVVVLAFAASALFCAALNVAVDRVVYRPLRNAPKLAPLVSAIGVSFVFMNVGLFWGGPQDVDFPDLLPKDNLLALPAVAAVVGETALTFNARDLLVFGVTVPLLAALTLFVKYTRTGRAMRATAQNPAAARLMGIDTDRVIAATFAVGGGLAGVGSVIYGLRFNTVSNSIGYQNGLFAFTAAVVGGIGSLPGAVLGGLLIGLVWSLGSEYVGQRWNTALVFAVLIVVLVFRPSGLFGSRTREKV